MTAQGLVHIILILSIKRFLDPFEPELIFFSPAITEHFTYLQLATRKIQEEIYEIWDPKNRA